MSTILRHLSFAWRYLVHGEHRSEGHSWEEVLAKLDWHESPLVGRYVRTEKGNWWADAPLPGLDEVDPEGIYMLAPSFEISSNFQLLSSEWTV